MTQIASRATRQNNRFRSVLFTERPGSGGSRRQFTTPGPKARSIPAEDAAQLTFEIEAALFLANAQYIVARMPEPIQRARRAIERRLESAADAARS